VPISLTVSAALGDQISSQSGHTEHTEHTEGGELTMLLSLPRKSTWTLHKVVPCVLQPWQQHSWSAGHARRRTQEGQRGSTHHRHQHTQSTPRWSKWNTFFRPPMHNKGGGHLPFGARSNSVERAGGDQHLKPQLHNQQRPSKLTPLQGLSAGLLQAF
jgi:hypothetical protein